jgi:hypothetical protein
MITKWQYNDHGAYRNTIKQLIEDNNYTSIDVGASAYYWSYPECKTVADAYPVSQSDVLQFNINIENKDDWKSIFEYVEINGKFDFSICSHTLEDVFNPIDLILNLEKISKKGYIAVPSKYDEFTKLYNNKYRGNAHHKQFFDVKDDHFVIYPKFSWIEADDRSDLLTSSHGPREIILMWEENIPYKVFGDGKPFVGDDALISNYYNQLL